MDEYEEELETMKKKVSKMVEKTNEIHFFDVQIVCSDIILPGHKYVLSSRSDILC